MLATALGRGARGRGGMQALLYVPRCWRAAIMRVQEAVVACGTGGGRGWRKPGWGFKMLGILGVGDCDTVLVC